MSTIQKNQGPWTNLAGQQLDSKYEKCRNITEEIYKRINITFQIKKLETEDQSDISVNSDQIDSNELSNETDLFACDKSDISSSTAGERPPPPAVNINNNNEEKNKPQYKRPRKRFRKRVKKRPPNRKRSDSEGSSDEAPLSRNVVILSPELKPKPLVEKKAPKKSSLNDLTLRELLKPTEMKVPTVVIEKIRYLDKEAAKKEATDKKNELEMAANKKSVKDEDRFEKETLAANKKVVKGDDRFEKEALAGKKKDLASDDKELGIDNVELLAANVKKQTVKVTDWKNCSLCSLSFRGERGLRRHMSMSHLISPEGNN